MSTWLLHTGAEPVSDVVDGALYTLEPGEPLEFENEAHARVFLERKAPGYGVVEVPFKKDKTGVHLDVPGALASAEKALEEAELKLVENYINVQLEDRIRKNFPAMPPQGRTAEVIRRRRISLAEFGIKPVGWDEKARRPVELKGKAKPSEE